MALHIQQQKGLGSGRKLPEIRNTVKAIVILASAAVAFKQVAFMVEEYLSFPTNTLYAIQTLDHIQSPAITICPNPSLRSSFAPPREYKDRESFLKWRVNESSTIVEDFKNASVSLFDLVAFTIPAGSRGGDSNIYWENMNGNSTVNGETIHVIGDGTVWNERTFSNYDVPDPVGGIYNKCYTLLRKEPLPVETGPCWEQSRFVINFNALYNTKKVGMTPHIDVYVHDQRQKFALRISANRVVLFNTSVTSIFLRPEYIQQQSKKEDPCIPDEAYSFNRCMENCFWERFQKRPGLSCVIAALMPKEINLTLPECRDVNGEMQHLDELRTAQETDLPALKPTDCDCPKRCNVIDYQVYADPAPHCKSTVKNGMANLFVGIASKRVAHILEKEKVNLQDLLSNIGGIVGVCLGISILTIFDVIELTCSAIRSKKLIGRSEKPRDIKN